LAIEAPQRVLPSEWNGIVPTQVFFDEAANIVEKSKGAGVTLRVMGGVGIALHCKDQREFAQKLGRIGAGTQEYTDLDFAGLMKERNKIADFLSGQLGYPKRKTTISSSVSQRQIYFHPQGYFSVDVMMDKLLIANHPIDFRSRLSVDPLTLSLADLLLEKIQMWVSFSQKDLKDCLLLLRTHGIGGYGDETESINADYIADILANDWGFYYTATTNLKKIAELLANLDQRGREIGIDPTRVTAEERADITGKIQSLLTKIEKHPKSFGWNARSKLGTKSKWYRDVETPQTIGDFGLWRLRETTK
jgi:hypothetical protein